MNHKSEKNPYQDTLNLPRTSFSIRANAQEKEPEILAYWKEHGIAQKVVDAHKEKQQFLLHDGPPYANGNIHIGHALNKTLKDVVCKSKRMSGHYVPFVRGWDCHGLPIELKVAAERDESMSFKTQCRVYAEKWIAKQAEQFEDLGVFADNRYYSTMSFGYEAAIVRALATFVEKGYIQRKGKAVPWCAVCKTVLALAEIEYADRKDPSCYTRFSLDDSDAKMLFPIAFEQHPSLIVSLLAWTTTPWTLPLNRAIMLNPSAEYAMLAEEGTDHAIIVAAGLAEALGAKTGKKLHEICRLDANVLAGKRVRHPLIDGFTVPVLFDESVIVTEGTAVLHVAPGCGPEDYYLGLKNGLEIYSPLSADGKYTVGIAPVELEGMPVADGQFWVLKQLAHRDKLFFKESVKHSYPHCWRCHQGLIFRATDQWFCDLQQNNLVGKAVEEIEKVTFIPDWGKSRLQAFVGNRTEWCISRQREWGVPIPALRCSNCEWTFMSHEFVNHVAAHIEKEGIEYWDRATLQSFVDEQMLPEDFKCQSCGVSDIQTFVKEKDILDVWFDSGVSNYAVLNQQYGLTFPADLYLEGSDQHRGWFQSSLLCSTVLNDAAPYRNLLTHGYVLDENKRKMSKSLGNVVAPQDVIERQSRDILRLWAATVDSEQDVVISQKLLDNVGEVYRKIRNTCRFLLSNLYDFSVEDHSIALGDMDFIDQYALAQLYTLNTTVKNLYNEYNFAGVVHTINNYCIKDLSALYLDIAKDRLYCDQADGRSRRSAQTVIHAALDVLTRLIAPIISFTAEEIAQLYLHEGSGDSVHLRLFSESYDIWEYCKMTQQADYIKLLQHHQAQDMQQATHRMAMNVLWTQLEQLRDVVLKGIELLREQGTVKHSLEAGVTLHLAAESEVMRMLNSLYGKEQIVAIEKLLKDWFIVSSVSLVASNDELLASPLAWCHYRIEHAAGVKCPRCWQWSTTMQEHHLCNRCYLLVK